MVLAGLLVLPVFARHNGGHKSVAQVVLKPAQIEIRENSTPG